MIRVTMLYPNESGATFDDDYFSEKHLPMARAELEPRGMVGLEWDKGISAADPNAPPPYLVIAHMTFNSVDECHEAFKAAGRQVMGDISNYTNVKPVVQIGEIV